MRVAFAKLCVSVPLVGTSRLRKNDRRTYGEAIGVIWLQTSCQPVGIFANTRLLWNWPAVAFPLYFSLIVAPIRRDRYIAVNPKSWPRRRPDSASIDGTTKQMRRGPNLTA